MKARSYEDFSAMLDKPYYDRSLVMFILESLLKISRHRSSKTYRSMEESFEDEIRQNGLVNPGIHSIPSPIVYRYLGIQGVDRETVSRRAEDYFSHA